MVAKTFFNPREKMLFSLGNLVLGLVAGLSARIGIGFLFFISIMQLEQGRRKRILRFYLALLPFMLASLLPALLGKDYASLLRIASTLLSSNMILGYLIFSSQPQEITEMIKGAGLPSPLTEMALLIYRYISMLGKFYRDVNMSLRARMAYRGMRSSYLALTKGVASIFLKALSHSRGTVLSLEARGFREKVFFNSLCHPLRRGFWKVSLLWSISLIILEVFL